MWQRHFPLTLNIYCGRQGRFTTSSESDSDDSYIVGWGFMIAVWGMVTDVRGMVTSVGGFENSMSGILLRFSSVVVDDGVDVDVGWVLCFLFSISGDSLDDLFDPFLVGSIGGVGSVN